jgi:hypothetical protein
VLVNLHLLEDVEPEETGTDQTDITVFNGEPESKTSLGSD